MVAQLRALIAIVAVLTLASATPLHAQEMSKKERKKVTTLLRKAKRAKKVGDRLIRKPRARKRAMARYALAAKRYIEAYEISELPAIVFELATVYEARSENAWALRGYQRYLELDPEGAYSGEAEARVEALHEAAQDDEGSGAGESNAEEIDPTEIFGEEPVPELEMEIEDEPEPKTEPVATLVKAAPKKPGKPASRGRVLRYSGIGVAVAGSIGVTLGIKFGLDASAASDDLSNKEGAWTDADRARIADGERAEGISLVLSIAGAVGIVGGGVLYYLGSKRTATSSAESAATLVPVLTGESMSMTWVGHF